MVIFLLQVSLLQYLYEHVHICMSENSFFFTYSWDVTN